MNISKLTSYLKNVGISGAAGKIHDRIFPRKQESVSYEQWQEQSRISSRGYARLSKEKFLYEPMIGVLAHASGSDRAAFMQSLNVQTYRNYRALKDCPDAEYILFAGPGCTLTPDMLTSCVRVLNENTGSPIDLIYFDSDCIDSSGKKVKPSFRPEYDPDLLRKWNYMGNVFLVRAQMARRIAFGPEESEKEPAVSPSMERQASASRQPEGDPHSSGAPLTDRERFRAFRKSAEAAGADEYHDFLKRLCELEQIPAGRERDGAVRHIPKILYHEMWEDAEEVSEEKHVPVRKEDMELISVIIPNRDHVEDLSRCIDSLRKVNAYRNIEILIIENNSSSPEIFSYYDLICRQDRRIRVITYEGQFNYSKINNFGALHAGGDYLLFLNNDTQILKPSTLWYMAKLAGRIDVGAVGALLMYPDRTVQHAGVILGYGGIAGHAYQGEELGDMPGEYAGLLFQHTRNVSAVTGACMMMRTSVYEQCGGFDEKLAVTFNDVDLCLRLRQMNLRILMCPNAELIHYESSSRGAEDTEEKVERFHSEIAYFVKRWKKELEAGDPFYNPNLTLTGRTFTCRDAKRESRPPYLKYLDME